MQLTIDTKEDSPEVIKKVIALLQEHVGVQPSSSAPANPLVDLFSLFSFPEAFKPVVDCWNRSFFAFLP